MAQKILMLLNARYPSDIRVKKETDALIGAGIEVHLLCLKKKDDAREENVEGIHVHRIDAGTNNYQLAFWDVIMSINFVHPRFKKAAKAILKKYQINIIHIHDLPLVGTALSLKREMKLTVVADFHENYPEALRTWFKWKKNPIVRLKNYFFLHPDRWSKFEAKAVLHSDIIIAVVEEMKERLIAEHKVAPEKIKVITNTEDEEFLRQPLDESVYSSLPGSFVVTYSGGIGPHRGVDTAILAMQFLKETPDIQLAIVGSGSPSVMDNLKKIVKDSKLDSVHFFGYQPFSKFYSYMHQADVNIIPHISNGHTDNTVPHKLFQGMMAGKPMLVSSSTPLKRIVEMYQSGLVFEAGNSADCAKMIRKLYEHADLRKQYGQNGIKATVEGPLNWETTQKELITLYKNI